MAYLFTLHAAVWKFLHYTSVDVYIFRYSPAHEAFVDKIDSYIISSHIILGQFVYYCN